MTLGGYESNSECILDYLSLFQALGQETAVEDRCRRLWADILKKETDTPETVALSTACLRQRFSLYQRDFLLCMAALALELDGGLRGDFRRRYGLSLPTVEYGLQLIEPICPSGCGTPAELAGPGPLGSLLLFAAAPTGYPMERPLILCRNVLAFLTGLRAADTPGCTLYTAQGEEWLPLYEEALAQTVDWYAHGTDHPLYLCAPVGAGRRTLLCRSCGRVVLGDLEALSSLSSQERVQSLREMAVLARLAEAPLCVSPDERGEEKSALERLCRRQGIPLVFLVEEEGQLGGAREVVRLPRQLTAQEREWAWNAFAPNAMTDAGPEGAMTVGTVRETANFARRLAQADGRTEITRADTRRALSRRGSALEFGIRYDVTVSMEDLVLPEPVLEQLRLICQAARCGGKLAQWGLPQYREGVTAVFHGPSGTGKTMAAKAIAHALGAPLLRADLSQIMDKYVGETEKHLGRLLRCAKENRCVLLFDEADTLFGKRASVSTGNDKYANLSTSFLLQEIEDYDGVALLSTNLLSNFDDAFLRRLHYIIRFALPDAALRERLWKRSIPEERREGELPFALLAQAELSPARICAAARCAAVEAMARGKEGVDAAGMIAALRLELEKSGKSLPRGLAEREISTGGE